METTISVPTPKTPTKRELDRDDRLRIQTLFFDANWDRAKICLQTGYTYDQRLIEWVTASRENRETPWCAIPDILGWDCGEKAIRTAFKKHVDWTDDQWDKVLWSDETWAQPGRHRRVWVTRRSDEAFKTDCWMFWGAISGKYGRHKGIFWEKDWETINEGSYSGIIIPLVDEILQQYPELVFQQDNAPGHSSAFTCSVLERAQIKVIYWPANSPDLNPIETIWNWMKDYIDDYYPQVHSSYPRLKRAIQEA
ncbi:transposable element tc1 protein [Rutstroemia sp. NJR-2017a WRK4]|nr:transposable element tc1 protein [Rutstroemia sp. NJR-2017a WRK4]